MKRNRIACALAALSMGLSGFAVAQNDKDVRADEANRREHLPVRQQQQIERQEGRRAQQGQRVDQRPSRGGDRDWDRGRGDDNRRGPPPREWNDRDRGAGPQHNFYRGGRLPPQYRDRVYVVDDWRGHRLQAPPRGYQWVQTGPDYVLVAITTGIIASILLGQ